jgi:hypothetical protein
MHPHKVLIVGNHDWIVDSAGITKQAFQKIIPSVTYLEVSKRERIPPANLRVAASDLHISGQWSEPTARLEILIIVTTTTTAMNISGGSPLCVHAVRGQGDSVRLPNGLLVYGTPATALGHSENTAFQVRQRVR